MANAKGFARNTQPFNYTGHPALAVPVGKSSAGLPVSMQLVGRFAPGAVAPETLNALSIAGALLVVSGSAVCAMSARNH